MESSKIIDILSSNCSTCIDGLMVKIDKPEAEAIIRPIILEHWGTIQAVAHGDDIPGVAYVKYDPLTIALNALGIITPKLQTESEIAKCIINKYYPMIIC